MQNERNINSTTENLYEHSGELYEFEAKVICCRPGEKGYEVILDKTAFFPEGGGQPSDEGMLGGEKLVDLKKVDGEIIHYLSNPISEGATVVCKLDRDIRFARMQAHIGEHLVSGIIHKKYGYENVGFHLSKENIVTLDVDGPLSDEDIAYVEREANRAIQLNVPVYPLFPSKQEIEGIDFRSKLELDDGLRLVVIEGFDICACCAPCLSKTGQIGLIKIIDATPHRGGMRLTMIAGMKAVDDYIELDVANSESMKLLSSKRLECHQALSSMLDRFESLKEENNSLKRKVAGFYENELCSYIKSTDDQVIYFYTNDLDEQQIRSILNASIVNKEGIIGIINESERGRNFIFVSSDESKYPLRTFIKSFNEKNGSRGGGSDKMVQGSIPHNNEIVKIDFN